MTDLEQWQESNARQLAEALVKLRERLERSATRAPSAQTAPAPTAVVPAGVPPEATTADTVTSRSFLERMIGRSLPKKVAAAPAEEQTEVANTPAAPAPAPVHAPEQMPSALTLLGQRLGLSPFEKDVLLLCVAMELDTRIPALCARAQGDPQKPFPTFALALTLFDEPAWDVVSPQRPLRFFRLIELAPNGAVPLTASPLRADERVVNFLKGLDHLDERLTTFCTPSSASTAELASSQSVLAEEIERRIRQSGDSGPAPVVQLLGTDPESQGLVAETVAKKIGHRLYRMPAELLPAQPAELEAFARLWQRESLLLPLALYLDGQELDDAPAEKLEPLHRFLARTSGLAFLGLREPLNKFAGRASLLFDVEKPTPAEQQTVWATALGPKAKSSPELLAGQFDLNLSAIRQIAQSAALETASKPELIEEKAWQLCCAQGRPRLDALAQRLELKVTRADLVLPKPEMSKIDEIAKQVRRRRQVYGEWDFARKMNRGLGIAALFAGPSGTGKTMAAEVLANELHLDLFRIDLSAVVSKYLGECEKNLRRLFDAAESGGAILFFDEADALFGKRSEVKDSHDRYANIEINYLLQRIEGYRGLAILATNMKSALDSAFLRRLRFIVDFPIPGADERRKIWENVFPIADAKADLAGVPMDALDFGRLAKLNLPGGSIHNVALHAAFLAAETENKRVTMPLVLDAARAEFQKLQRPINAADFQWTETKTNGQRKAPAEPVLQPA